MNKSIESQLKQGVVFSGSDPVGVKIWRSNCRHYKIQFTGRKVYRISLTMALECINLYDAIPTPPITPKTALQSLYDALKAKIEACYKALQLLPKVYQNWIKRTFEEGKVWARLESLLAYKQALVRLKHRIEGVM